MYTNLSFIITLATLTISTHAVPTPSKTALVATLAQGPLVSKMSSPEEVPGTIIIVPPPLFDPPEPRPNLLFDSNDIPITSLSSQQANKNTGSGGSLRTPPIPESRKETLPLFDGAHIRVHPFKTPYTPESLPGTCAYILSCSVARTSAEIILSLALFLSVAYCFIYTIEKVIRRLLWTAKGIGRNRSPSGALRVEPELGVKIVPAGADSSKVMQKIEVLQTPVVKVWSEKGLEQIIFTG